MRDLPILFSAPMVRAILREIEQPGTGKTQTRRVLSNDKPMSLFNGQWSDSYVLDPGNASWRERDLRYHIGDRLYVREAWRTVGWLDDTAPRDLTRNVSLHYEADHVDADNLPLADGRFRQGMHMPRWVSRITLIVTDVRVERLQDISEANSLAEGVPSDDEYAGSFAKEYCHHCEGSGVHGAFGEGYGVIEVDCAECETPKLRYRNLWNHIYGPGSWEANPWVAAYTYTPILGNIDQLEQVAA